MRLLNMWRRSRPWSVVAFGFSLGDWVTWADPESSTGKTTSRLLTVEVLWFSYTFELVRLDRET